MCRVFGVSVSGYYDWRGREPSQHEREDGELAKHIHRIFHAHRGVYGSPRVQVELRELGIRCSKERIARLMREMDLAAKRRRNQPIGTKQRKLPPMFWVASSMLLHPIRNGSAIRPLSEPLRAGCMWQ